MNNINNEIIKKNIDSMVDNITKLSSNPDNLAELTQLKYKKLNQVNGFDGENLDNARQNNYVWSMAELDGFIYIGTGRNVLLKYLYQVLPGIKLPLDWMPNVIDHNAEIWRYKKDGSLPWQRVYKAKDELGIDGFRFMIRYDSFGVKPCLYAASNGKSSIILKSTNGTNWFELTSNTLRGNTSRAMI